MKNTFRLEIISTDGILTQRKQKAYRAQLEQLMKLKGIVSICLEAENLYVEFRPGIFDLEAFKQVLRDIGFPMRQQVNLASFHYAV